MFVRSLAHTWGSFFAPHAAGPVVCEESNGNSGVRVSTYAITTLCVCVCVCVCAHVWVVGVTVVCHAKPSLVVVLSLIRLPGGSTGAVIQGVILLVFLICFKRGKPS